MGYKTTYIDGDLALGRNADVGGDVNIHGMARVKRHLKVEGFLDAPNIKGALKGFFRNEDELQKEFPKPRPGWMAIVLEGESVERGFVHVVKDGAWEQVGEEAKPLELVIDSLNVYSTKTELANTKEELLKRLQGVSENSNASTDPFKYLGDFNSIEDLEGVLDGMMSSVKSHVGIFRAVVSTRVITVVNNPISAGTGEYNQMIMGCLRIKDDGTLEQHGQSFNVLYRISYNGEWLKWNIANNKIIEEMHNTLKDSIDNEVARAKAAEEELLKRLQGVSENSNASTDPFRYLGDLSKTKFFETIDALNGDSAASREECAGHFRATVEHRIVDVYSEQIGWENNVWVQRMVCPMQLFNEVAQKENVYTKTGVDKDGNTVYYKYRTHTYTQNFDTLTGASTNQNTVKTYTRTCNNGVWGDWKDVSNNYINSPNYGKKIAFFGGSFAQNMSLTSTPWPFDYQGRTYSLMQYIAEKLGATSFDDYAVGSQGVIVGDILIMEQLQTAGAGYDIYVIFGGINDFGNEIPLGESNGDANDTTYCGGLKAAFDWIRRNNKSAKIYTVTPFKAYTPDDRYWNPRSNIKKNGHTFYEFIQAQKEVAQIHGVPCFDLWANQQFSGASASEHYYKDLLHPNGKGYQAVADALVEFLAYGLGSGVVDVQALVSSGIPAATAEKAGVMSAEDKVKLYKADNNSKAESFRTTAIVGNSGLYYKSINDVFFPIGSSGKATPLIPIGNMPAGNYDIIIQFADKLSKDIYARFTDSEGNPEGFVYIGDISSDKPEQEQDKYRIVKNLNILKEYTDVYIMLATNYASQVAGKPISVTIIQRENIKDHIANAITKVEQSVSAATAREIAVETARAQAAEEILAEDTHQLYASNGVASAMAKAAFNELGGNADIIETIYIPRDATGPMIWRLPLNVVVGERYGVNIMLSNALKDGSEVSVRFVNNEQDENADSVWLTTLKAGTETFTSNAISLDSLNTDTAYLRIGTGLASKLAGYTITVIVADYDGIFTNGRLNTLESNINELKNRVDDLEISKKTLKVLCIGNSFTQDAMGYVPYIMKNVAPDVDLTLAIAYIGGSPLAWHLANLIGESVTVADKTYSPQEYEIYSKSVNGDKWVATFNKDIDSILKDDDWDIITFQQSGGTSGQDYFIHYAPFIHSILKEVSLRVVKPVKFGWLSVHGTYNTTAELNLQHYERTVANTQKVVDDTSIDVVFPYGTAVQNLRTIADLNTIGNYVYGFMQADSGHLQNGIGCLCASYACALKLLEIVGEARGVMGDTLVVDNTFMKDNNIPGPNPQPVDGDYAVLGMTDRNRYLAQVAAVQAIKKPYEVTDINKCNV